MCADWRTQRDGGSNHDFRIFWSKERDRPWWSGGWLPLKAGCAWSCICLTSSRRIWCGRQKQKPTLPWIQARELTTGKEERILLRRTQMAIGATVRVSNTALRVSRMPRRDSSSLVAPSQTKHCFNSDAGGICDGSASQRIPFRTACLVAWPTEATIQVPTEAVDVQSRCSRSMDVVVVP